MSDFSNILKNLRFKADKKQSEIADYLDISVQSYSAYENGREPNYDNLIKLSEYFNVSTDYLLGISNLTFRIDDYELIANTISNINIENILEVINSSLKDKTDNQKEDLLNTLSMAFNVMNIYFGNIELANDSNFYLQSDADKMLPVLKILNSVKTQPISWDEMNKVSISQNQIDSTIKYFLEFIYKYTLYTFNFDKLDINKENSFW